MAVQWHNLLFRILIWFALEIILTCLGFDDLADYSEFIIENKQKYVHQMDCVYFYNMQKVNLNLFNQSYSLY